MRQVKAWPRQRFRLFRLPPPAPIAHTFSYFKRNGTATPQTATLLTDGTLNIDGKIITGVNYSVVGTCLSGGNETTLTACFSPPNAPHTMLLCGPDPTTSAAGTLLYVLFDSPDTNLVSATSTSLLSALQSETSFLGTGVYTNCSGSFSTSWIRNFPQTNYYLWPDVITTYTSTFVSDLLSGAVIYSTPAAGNNYNEYVAVRVSGVKQRAKLSRLEVETASNSFHLGM